MIADRSSWAGLASGRGDPAGAPVIELPIKPSPRGGSGTFLAADHDGVRWWVKPLNNQQGEMVPATEALVAGAGTMIGAPVCATAVVWLPPEIRGWEFRPGAAIVPGYAHASRAVETASESSQLIYRDRDDNRRRHAGVYALYDWCWGADDQWLYSEIEDRQVYSHDHGWYLPESGPAWNEATLTAHVGEAHRAVWPSEGVDDSELARLATRLRGVSRVELVELVRRIPASWPVGDADLEALGWFLESRAPEVAARLETLRGGHV
jgi:hypothetical protein